MIALCVQPNQLFGGAAFDAVERSIFIDIQLEHRIELDTPSGELSIERLAPARP